MKATLEFDLPEEADDHRLACEAGKLHGALWDVLQEIREVLKHGSPSKATADELEKIRTIIYDDCGHLLDQ